MGMAFLFVDDENEALCSRWQDEVLGRRDAVDPGMEYVWDGLAIAFAIGAGYSVGRAREFARMLDSRGLL